jgi:ABC-type transport system substrate-binding protein
MIGTLLQERYQITGELGRGGMGVVYKASDPLLRREVAIKMVPPAALSPEAEARFEREAQTVAQLDHPALVPIHDLGRHGNSFFIVMPLVQGETLATLIKRGRLPLSEVLEIGIQIARGLSYSHARGVIHRDVKPSNVMISRQGDLLRARLMDFGLAFDAGDQSITRTGNLPGTLAYLSPEQVSELPLPLDGRADLYALGAVLYECLAGEPPFSGPLYTILYRTLQEKPASLRSRGVALDAGLEALVLSCLAKDPRERPADGEVLAGALEKCRGELRVAPAPAPAPRELPAPPSSRRRELPLVGRERELAALQERLQAALGGECQCVAIGGEAGTGKTRLLQELEGLARPRQLRVLRGRFSDWAAALPYQGWCELIQDFFRHRETTSSAEPGPDLGDLAADLISLFPVLSEISELRTAAGRSGSSPDLRASLAEKRTAEPGYVFELLARTLARLADGRPLVFLLENLHSSEASLEVLLYLLRRLGSAPLLFAFTYRPSEVPRGHALRRFLDSFAGDPRLAVLQLQPLSPAEVRRLAEVFLGSSALAVDLVEKLHEATEGNPLFCLEMIKTLADSGSIVRDENGFFALSEEILPAQDALPATLQQAEERRLDGLEEGQRALLQIAAVLGKSFEFQDLEQLGEAAALGLEGDELEAALDTLVEQGLLVEDRKSRGDRLSFSSGILRDLAYGELSRRKRRSLHRAHAAYLEQRYAGRLERVLPQLVHHSRSGDLGAETVRYSLELARKTLPLSPEDALRTAKAALDFVEEEGVADPQLAEAQLYDLLARAHAASSQSERAFRDAEKAAELFARRRAAGPLASLCLLAAEIAWQGRRMELVRAWVDRGLQAARDAGPPETLRRLLSLGATVANLRGDGNDNFYSADLRRLEQEEGERGADQQKERGGTLICALNASFETFDPALFHTIEEWEVAANIFETLLCSDAEGLLSPGLCRHWQAGADSRSFTFTLRPGLRFADGQPADATAVAAALTRTAQESYLLPPALAALRGIEDLRQGAAELAGLRKGRNDSGAETLTFELSEELPIFPALLTDLRTAIAKKSAAPGGLAGTGPFRFLERRDDRLLLERNPLWRGHQAHVDQLEFRFFADAARIAQAFKVGEVSLAHDLLPEDLDDLLREPRWHAAMVENTKKNVFWALFNQHGPLGRNAALRRALFGVLRPTDLVWRALGRFAVPATCLVPPGMLGHDTGRRTLQLDAEKAAALLAEAGLETPIVLKVGIHPLFRDRFAVLFEALREEWASLGVTLEVTIDTIGPYVELWDDPQRAAGIDLMIGRWAAAYDDPDNFTYNLFHSRSGLLRGLYCSPEADALLERARREVRPAARAALYQRFEDLVAEESAILPLFHEIDYRLAQPEWRGLQLRNSPPYVAYAEIGRAAEEAGPAPAPLQGGEIHAPIALLMASLEPASSNLVSHHEVVSAIFETLTRLDEQARIRPWLAESVEALQGGRAYRFRLRRGLRFHDGRRLTSRDVRYSFERLLLSPSNELHFLLLPIQGARALAEGESNSLQGFRILSPRDFLIELHRPLAFFPALLTHPGTAIVPEESRNFAGRWRDGVCGSGPFRVVGFDPGRRVDLERNPSYWRAGWPKCDRLVFHSQPSPAEVLEAFQRGRLTLAGDLLPADAEALRRSPDFRGDYQESPSLSTYFLAANVRGGPLAERARRTALFAALEIGEPIRETLGRLVIRAHGIAPPGLLGFEPPRGQPRAPSAPVREGRETLRGLRLRLAIHPVFGGRYAAFRDRLVRQLEGLGVDVEKIECDIAELSRLGRTGGVDLVLSRWVAVYPDTDCFLIGLLDSREGVIAGLCASPEIDRLIEKGRLEADPALRHTIYRRLEELSAHDHLLLPLFHAQTYRFAQPGVRGMRLGITVPEVRYEDLYVDGG